MYTGPYPKFCCQNLLAGMSRLISTTDARLPTTPALFGKLINVLQVVCSSLYQVIIFSAYFGLFRVSELVLDCKKGSSSDAMDASSIHFLRTIKLLKFMWLIQKQINLVEELYWCCLVEGKVCPVKLLKQFSMQRPKIQGPFFCYFVRSRYLFNAVLKKSLSCIGVDKNTNYIPLG